MVSPISHAEHVQALTLYVHYGKHVTKWDDNKNNNYFDHHIKLMTVPCLVHMHSLCASLTVVP